MITGLLMLLPAALLFAGLILGRYPGEDALEVARTPVRAPRPRPVALVLPAPGPSRAPTAVARLAAAALAARAPPCG